ncbi:MAG: alpha/beta fold hydrolase [Bacteroidota bacterium]
MELFFRETGEGEPLIILHGVFGSSDNWLSIAKILGEHHKIYLLDQRNHGQSPHSDEFTYEAMANDLNLFIDQHGIENPIIMGHSMGGKVAMRFAMDFPDKLQKLIVVDIAPKSYPVHHDAILDGLCALDLSELKSRNDADEQLSKFVHFQVTRQFLLKNLTRSPEGFKWKINLPVIKRDIDKIGEGLDEKARFDKPTLFIRGLESDYVLDEDIPLIEQMFTNQELVSIEGAGHWVHAEKPQQIIDAITQFT